MLGFIQKPFINAALDLAEKAAADFLKKFKEVDTDQNGLADYEEGLTHVRELIAGTKDLVASIDGTALALGVSHFRAALDAFKAGADMDRAKAAGNKMLAAIESIGRLIKINVIALKEKGQKKEQKK